MTIRVALNHKTSYLYDRPIHLGPQVVRLRPAAHSRTPINSYSLRVTPSDHFLNWQQDPFGNYLARCVFEPKVTEFTVEVDLVATMTVINPFDFFLEPFAVDYPFAYPKETLADLQPYTQIDAHGPKFHTFLGGLNYSPRRTIDFLVDLNCAVEREIAYTIRMEPGVQTPEETLCKKSGSCRDSSWLLVQLLRHLGFAARFTSGYLIQLKADAKPLEGPEGPPADFTDLHAWAEVFLPGAGWVGLDPTSGLFAGEGHIPLACTPQPVSAAPITGSLDECRVDFHHEMSVNRIYEAPRVTLPYSETQWEKIDELGHKLDQRLAEQDVRLTMGGEPTFVSIDDMDGEEWQTAAVGPTKQTFAFDLMGKLKHRFTSGALVHHGQGKWYPGEPLPRWSMAIYWRPDGEPIWKEESLLADPGKDYGFGFEQAQVFAKSLARNLAVTPGHAVPAKEDAMYYMWRERRLPANVDLHDNKLDSAEERQRVARIFEQGLTSPVGMLLPLQHMWWHERPHWRSGEWVVRADEMFLLPGDSPMGYRLPLQSLTHEDIPEHESVPFFRDPLDVANLDSLDSHDQLRESILRRFASENPNTAESQRTSPQSAPSILFQHRDFRDEPQESDFHKHPHPQFSGQSESASQGVTPDSKTTSDSRLIRTALCIEPRDGKLYVFLPPVERLESFLDLITAVEATAHSLEMPVLIEGYQPPHDSRLQNIKVTPDPGVIEVNVHPARNWQELKSITTGVYEEARTCRLGTEKFDLDGQHTGTGGGNHLVLGGATPGDSPWLRRPDLLRSFVTYWHNHPALSYLFSGKFIGPTSQAPRVDESRMDALHELQIACQEIQRKQFTPPWLVDRVFRHLLVDGTGNTHRAEFCIDKLYSPDSSTGRLGLVELRGFEMPPHARMSLTQQLLIRGLLATFWDTPYERELVDWRTSLHDRYLLPHFVWEDFEDVVEDLNSAGYPFDLDWFSSHQEFRFPLIGEFAQRSIQVELRKAIEPWYVLGEEPAGGGTARFVDSSVERLQVKVRGMTDTRHALVCNGQRVPLHPTGVEGEFVAGVRYRAWQPPSCLHPTIPVATPLIFDLIDTWNSRSIGGCQFHVSNPTGLNPGDFPVNAFEAESRRAARFFNFGHTGGKANAPQASRNVSYPMTLDLRRP